MIIRNMKEFCELAVLVNGIVTCEGCEDCQYFEDYLNGIYYDCELID